MLPHLEVSRGHGLTPPWLRVLGVCLALVACAETEDTTTEAPVDGGVDVATVVDAGPAVDTSVTDVVTLVGEEVSPEVSGDVEGGLPEITVPDIHFEVASPQEEVTGGGGDAEDVAEGPPGPIHALFVGNSYTSGNNLKGWVADLAEAAGYEPGLTTQAITKGGAWLSDHYADADTMETIATGGFTHVVLQEQSYLPLVAKGQFLLSATALAAPIHQSGADPVFFETWAREEGSSLYETDLEGYTPETMQAALRDAYMTAASANDGVYAPVGDVWEATLAAHPEIELFSGDGSHANQAGTYLAACVFYQVLTGESPVGIPLGPTSLTDEEITAIQEMAATGPEDVGSEP